MGQNSLKIQTNKKRISGAHGVNGWHLVHLEDVCDVITDGSHFSPKDFPGGLPMASVKDMTRWGINIKGCRTISPRDFQELIRNGCQPRIGDVLIAKDGATCLDTVCEFTQKEDIVLLSSIAILRPGKMLDPGYLRYYLESPVTKALLKGGYVSGSAIPRVVLKDFRNAPIYLPPLIEQRGIAELLESLDNKIELNRRMNETLEATARAIFKSWFVDPLENGFPEGWKLGALNDLLVSSDGGEWGSDSAVGDDYKPAFCIRGADIPSLQLGGIGKMPTRFLRADKLKLKSLRSGDIVVEISGGSPTQSTGRPVYVTEDLLSRFEYPIVCSNFCRFIRPKQTISSPFIYSWLRYLYANDEFFQYENGTTGIKNLAFGPFCETHDIAIPSIALFDAFNATALPIFRTMQANGLQTETLASIRDALLPKLMSGQIRMTSNS